MAIEETSTEYYSDSSQPSSSPTNRSDPSFELPTFPPRTLTTAAATTTRRLNSPSVRSNESYDDASLSSNDLNGDSSGNTDNYSISSAEESDHESSEDEDVSVDLPQLPYSSYSSDAQDLHLVDGGSNAKERILSASSDSQGEPDGLDSDSRLQHFASRPVTFSQADMLQPSESMQQFSCEGPNSSTEKALLAAVDSGGRRKRLRPSSEIQFASMSRHIQTADIRRPGSGLHMYVGEEELSELHRSIHSPRNALSPMRRSDSGDGHPALLYSHPLINEMNVDDDFGPEGQGEASHPDGSVISEVDEITESDDFEHIGHDCRVDIASLPVMKNPLQKAGRHTVIRGRLAEDHPFSIAAHNLGYKLVSKELNGRTGSFGEPERRRFFMRDVKAFLKEIGNRHFKIPVIGGGDLDIYMLTKEVMLVGGVQNVVRKRAFRIVAQQLGIPKTCTSAASVLKGAYERLLFHYEQRLVFGKWPENPTKAVNMKERVCEEKMQERRARTSLQMRTKRTCETQYQLLAGNKDVHSSVQRESEPISDDQFGMMSNSTRLMLLMTDDDSEIPFEMPKWTQHLPRETGFDALIAAVQQIDAANVQDANEAVLVAIAECFVVRTGSTAQSQDLCLAHNILSIPAETHAVRKTQGFLFNLLVVATSASTGPRLASNKSAEGLINALVHILADFFQCYLHSETQASPWMVEDSLPFNLEQDEEMRQDIAQAYCSLRILSELSREEWNRAHLFLRTDLLQVCTSFMTYANTHRTFLLSILDTLCNGSSLLSVKDQPGVIPSLLKALLGALEKCAGLENTVGVSSENVSEIALDFEMSRKILQTFSSFSQDWGLDQEFVAMLMTDIAQLFFQQHKIDALDSAAELALKLAVRYPKLAAEQGDFVSGILQLLHRGQCLHFTVEALCTIHAAHSLAAHKDEIRRLCQWQLLSDTQVHSLSNLLDDLAACPSKVSSPCPKISPKIETSQTEHNDQTDGSQDATIPVLSLFKPE